MTLKLTIVTLMGFCVRSASVANASDLSQLLHRSQIYVGVNNGGPYGGNPYGNNRYDNPPCHGHRHQPAPVPYYVPAPVPAYPPVPSYYYIPQLIEPVPGWNQFGNPGYFQNQFPPLESRLQYVPGHYEVRN
jgi:hypothetical protein